MLVMGSVEEAEKSDVLESGLWVNVFMAVSVSVLDDDSGSDGGAGGGGGGDDDCE